MMRASARRSPFRNRWTSSSTSGRHVRVDELHDVLGVRARAEDGLKTEPLERLRVLFRDDAPAEEEHVGDAALLQIRHDAREEFQVRPRKDAQADDVDVFLE